MVTLKEKITKVNFLAVNKLTGQPVEMETEVDYHPKETTDRAKARLIGKVNAMISDEYECIYIQATESITRTYEMSEEKFKEHATPVWDLEVEVEGGND